MRRCYFDNAATTYRKPDGLYSHMAEYMLESGGNSGRGEYDSAVKSGRMIRETRDLLLRLMHCQKDRETVFTPSATIALNIILNGIPLAREDTVYISHFEHNAVTRVLFHLQKAIGFSIVYLDPDLDSFRYDTDTVRRQFQAKKPRLVVLSHVSNVCGLIAPAEEISRLAKEYGAETITDASQACGVIDLDLRYIDYYVFAGHKTLLASFGAAGFICRKNCSLKPFLYGGTGIDSANSGMPAAVPERFEAGSQNIMAIAGLNYSLEWILKTGTDAIFERESMLYKRLLRLLENYPFIHIVARPEEASAIVSCQFSGYAPDEVGRVLDHYGVSVRTGLHCAPLAHKFLGTFPEGTVRFSVSYFTEDADFEGLEEALDLFEENM